MFCFIVLFYICCGFLLYVGCAAGLGSGIDCSRGGMMRLRLEEMNNTIGHTNHVNNEPQSRQVVRASWPIAKGVQVNGPWQMRIDRT